MNKLGFKENQVGHMTLKKWNKLYKAYKNDYDNDVYMKARGLMYRDLERVTTIDDVIPL